MDKMDDEEDISYTEDDTINFKNVYGLNYIPSTKMQEDLEDNKYKESKSNNENVKPECWCPGNPKHEDVHCATDGVRLFSYPSECAFKCASTRNPKLELKWIGHCEKYNPEVIKAKEKEFQKWIREAGEDEMDRNLPKVKKIRDEWKKNHNKQ